ncbi:MAG TPA: DUF4136 domain-containing protein [Candidatus Angelobacter sp.]|nr:DUF4136 domain-containing protein [Candidatus Angelobacter sp.]
MRSSSFLRALLLIAFIYGSIAAVCQQPPPAQKKPTPEPPTERLAHAKTVLVTRTRGNGIPYDVIKSTIEGWVRFTMVETADKADLIVEVATSGGDSDVRATASDGPSMLTGRPERSSSTSKDLSNAEITMTVYDAKNKRVLWTATQTAKYAMKQTTRENNMVEAAEKLASKFHDRLEPPPPKEQD